MFDPDDDTDADDTDLYTADEVAGAVAEAARAAYLKGRAAERRGLTDVFRFAVLANGSGEKMLKALDAMGPIEKAPEIVPADDPDDDVDDDPADDADPSPAEVLAAAVAFAEECLAHGTDPQPGLDALYALATDPGAVEKAFREADHPRNKHGVWISKDRIQAAKTDPKLAAKLRKEVKPEDAHKLDAALEGKVDLGRTKRGQAKHDAATKREVVQASRSEAKRLAYKLTHDPAPEDYHALIPHLSTLTAKELSHVRLMLGASFGGGRTVEARRQRLVAHARAAAFEARLAEQGIAGAAADDMRTAAGLSPKGEEPSQAPAGKPEDEPGFTGEDALGRQWVNGELVAKPDDEGPTIKIRAKEKKPQRRGKADSVLQQVIDYGGIDPESHDLLRNYESMRRATQDGVPLAAFKRGGMGLDALAQQLVSSGHIRVPGHQDPGTYVLDLLKDRAYTLSADLSEEYDRAYEEHARALEHARDGHTAAEVASAVRDGEAAGRAEAEENPLGEHGGGAEFPPGDEVDPRPVPESLPAGIARLKEGVDASEGLSEDQRKRYHAAVDHVAERLPLAAHARLAQNLHTATFHADRNEIIDAAVQTAAWSPHVTDEGNAFLQEWAAKRKASGAPPGGMYVPASRAIHADGVSAFGDRGRHAESGRDELPHHLYAHEIGHAIDGPHTEISDSEPWRDAFAKEIAHDPWTQGAPPLTDYGAQNPQEGLAEFARLLYASDLSTAQIRKEFPGASAVFDAHGLMPPERAGTAGTLPGVFAERVPVPGSHDAHIDTVKPNAGDIVPGESRRARKRRGSAGAADPLPALDAQAALATHATIDEQLHPTRAAAEAAARGTEGGAVAQIGRKWLALKPLPPKVESAAAGVDLDDPAALAAAAHAAARAVPQFNGDPYQRTHAGAAIRHKPLISTVYDQMQKDGTLAPGTSLDDFKAALLRGHVAGALDIGRLDLVQTVPDDLRPEIARSRHAHGNAEYHLINTPTDAPAPPGPAPGDVPPPSVAVPRKPLRAHGREHAPTDDEIAAASQPYRPAAEPSPSERARAAAKAHADLTDKHKADYDRYNALPQGKARDKLGAKLDALDPQFAAAKTEMDAAHEALAAANGHDYGVHVVREPGAAPELVSRHPTLAAANLAHRSARDALLRDASAVDSGRDLADEYGAPGAAAHSRGTDGKEAFVDKVGRGAAPPEQEKDSATKVAEHNTPVPPTSGGSTGDKVVTAPPILPQFVGAPERVPGAARTRDRVAAAIGAVTGDKKVESQRGEFEALMSSADLAKTNDWANNENVATVGGIIRYFARKTGRKDRFEALAKAADAHDIRAVFEKHGPTARASAEAIEKLGGFNISPSSDDNGSLWATYRNPGTGVVRMHQIKDHTPEAVLAAVAALKRVAADADAESTSRASTEANNA